jgi:two-component system CitB family sensor kinase
LCSAVPRVRVRLTRVRYSTRVLLLQLLTVIAVVAVCAGIFSWLAREQLKDEAMTSAVSIARSVAESPGVRAAVAAAPGDDTDGTDGTDSDLQRTAVDTGARTGALFVVVTDRDGVRLAHPDPALIGDRVSTDHEPALRGEETTAVETGTLGPSARAKVPVYAPDSRTPVGEVSVGFRTSTVFDDLPRVLWGVAAAAGVALALGAVVSVIMRRRLEHTTLGLQPEELVELVQGQSAVLDGVAEGVLSVDTRGRVQVCNGAAARLLGLGTAEVRGRGLAEIGLPAHVVELLRSGGSSDDVVVGGRVLYLDARTVTRHGRDLGTVTVVRDRTELTALSERLGTVRAMGDALRVQRHEFANRVHVAAGLLDAGRTGDARAFLREMVDRGPVRFPLEGAELLNEPFLQSFLGAKSAAAAERGVTLRTGPETLLLGTVGGAGAAEGAAEDVATVLGNLVDNAVTAAVGGPDPWVEVTALQDGDALTLVVADSGPGLDAADGAAPGDESGGDNGDPVHGHGIGLALVRDLVGRRGGELWVIDRGGGPGSGAVLGVRLPGTMGERPEAGTQEEAVRRSTGGQEQ